MAHNKNKGKKVKEYEIVKKFKTITEESSIKPKYFKNILYAFIVGGSICLVGQIIHWVLMKWGLDEELLKSLLPVIMIFLGAFLTGIGVYDKIAKHAGAGTIVPITGFANSVVSPAMEFKSEGFVYGLAAKMFVIAGPIIVYGVTASALVGIIYFIIGSFIMILNHLL